MQLRVGNDTPLGRVTAVGVDNEKITVYIDGEPYSGSELIHYMKEHRNEV